ncbi:hypothetical protein LC612_37490 [Nostoc sp. CHAB 5834]|nr:hypothetical protein [Nostoc sp. CHAB 5834]
MDSLDGLLEQLPPLSAVFPPIAMEGLFFLLSLIGFALVLATLVEEAGGNLSKRSASGVTGAAMLTGLLMPVWIALILGHLGYLVMYFCKAAWLGKFIPPLTAVQEGISTLLPEAMLEHLVVYSLAVFSVHAVASMLRRSADSTVQAKALGRAYSRIEQMGQDAAGAPDKKLRSTKYH